jgi:hypothetical protein
LVIGPTRAPAFYDGIHAVAKRGQMNGGREESLEHKRLLLEKNLAAIQRPVIRRAHGSKALIVGHSDVPL